MFDDFDLEIQCEEAYTEEGVDYYDFEESVEIY